jgi:dTDP-4-dehydrorhamnose 3,5-epimerase
VIFTETTLRGAHIIEPERHADERGFFARVFCQQEFEQHGIVFSVAQCNLSVNRKKGTLRGMHYQAEPYAEAKLVRCTAGAIYDVMIDLRVASPTFMRWVATELTAENRRMHFVPRGFAHGFQTLDDDSEVFYHMSALYRHDAARGCRWDDSAFGIEWPPGPRVISDRDRAFPDFSA